MIPETDTSELMNRIADLEATIARKRRAIELNSANCSSFRQERSERHCHGNDRGAENGPGRRASCCCDGILPARRRFGSKGPQRRSGDEVALKVERVMDGSVHIEKALGGASRLEPLHFPLASSHGLMRVFCAIVRRSPCS